MGMYVVQVVGGQESHAASLVSKLAADVVDECFVPRFELMKRKGGAWVRSHERLFPGYLFMVTGDPVAAAQRLRQIPMFMRVLGSDGDTFIPLRPEEVAWLKAFTTTDAHVMELSQGIIEGDRVIVVEGPLKGHEAQITRIDRHRRLAWMDMSMFGRMKSIRVGLEVVSKRN